MTEIHWPSTLPADCSFELPQTFRGITFTGRHTEYAGTDTWYPSWASDDNLYSSWVDGNIDWPIGQNWNVTNFQCSSDTPTATRQQGQRAVGNGAGEDHRQ